MVKLVTIILLLLASQVLRADISLEAKNESFAVIFRSGNSVYYEKCPSSQIRRGCSGKFDLASLYSTSYEEYVKRIESFYGLNNLVYGGLSGRVRLVDKITRLKKQIDSAELTAGELKEAHSLLKYLVSLREKSSQAEREVLAYLENGTNTIFNEQYQKKRALIIQFAFYDIGFSSQESLLVRKTEKVTRSGVANACSAMGDGWSPITEGQLSTNLVVLSQSPLLTSGVEQIWGTKEVLGQYKVACGFSCGSNQHDVSIRYYDPISYSKKQSYASGRGMSICRYTTGCNIESESEVYVPATANLLHLKVASDTYSISTVSTEVQENVPSAVSYKALCQKTFDMKEEGASGYLNGSHFATFSLYDLEKSLDNLSLSVYKYWADFFTSISKALADVPLTESDDLRIAYRNVMARAFVLNAIEPVLNDIQSRLVKEEVLPDYKNAKDEWNSKLKIHTLQDIELNPAVYKLVIRLLYGAFSASKPFIPVERQQEIDTIIPELGKAMAQDLASVSTLVALLDAHQALIKDINLSPRTHGFGVMIEGIQNFLKGAN